MKFKTSLLVLILLALFSCNKKNKSEDLSSYAYSSEIKLNSILDAKVGSWIKEGLDCYGILVMYDDNENIVNAKTIKAKTLVITETSIKMKALESITLAPKAGCTKLGLDKGDTWWENEGDLFQTKEEANIYLKTLLDEKKIKKADTFTVD